MNKIQKAGMPPGTLLYTGAYASQEARVTVVDYSTSVYHFEELTDLDKLKDFKERKTITWVNVDGLSNIPVIEKIGQIFNLHPLILEDILHTEQRAKADLHDDYIYLVMHMLNYNEKRDTFESEQLSIVFGSNYVITFQEEKGDNFDSIRERIKKQGKITEKGADYLAYSLIDVIVDSYYHVMERMGEWIEGLEAEIMKRPNRKRTFEINDMKRDANFLRKHIWPVREMLHSLQRHEEGLLSKDTRVYLNDAYDHCIQVMDNLETYRDMIANLMDLYLSNLSFKMNEVMKTLTIIATIFIPITFITSLYGMNFQYMPELHWKYGYFAVVGIIVAISCIMLIYFKRKGWLG
jgi:magnesium transporter